MDAKAHSASRSRSISVSLGLSLYFDFPRSLDLFSFKMCPSHADALIRSLSPLCSCSPFSLVLWLSLVLLFLSFPLALHLSTTWLSLALALYLSVALTGGAATQAT